MTLTAPGESPITLDETTIDTYLSDAIGSDDWTPRGWRSSSGSSSSSSASAWSRSQVDGKWYVSPVRSFSDIFVSLLKGLEPGDVDYLISRRGN